MGRHVVKLFGNVTLDASYSGCDVVVSGGLFSVTLAANQPDDTDICLINGDAGNSKILVGFPSDVKPRLMPKQSVSVNTSASSWFTTCHPQSRWLAPNLIVYVNGQAPAGGDGLSDGTAFNTTQQAASFCQNEIDIQQTTPTIALKGGQTYDPLLLGGQPTGGNLIQLSVYGDGAATIYSQTQPAITIGDNAEIDIRVNALSSTTSLILRGNVNDAAATASGIYQHNNGLFDQEGDVTIIGNGPNGSAYFFDGPCPGASIANGFKVGGIFGDIFRMDEGGGRYTLGGTIQPITWNGQACSAARLFGIYGENELILGGSYPGGYANLGPSLVSGNALLVTNGIAIPGGVTTQQGGRVSVGK